jgi:DNA-binding NarL/FixJ family response regulator
MTEQITLVVIDDHPLFRQGVADSLSLEPGVRVIGLAASAQEGLQLIRNTQPQVAIVDINLPGVNGQQLTLRVIAEKLPTRVVLLTAYDDVAQKVHGLSAGARAYCTKDIQPEGLYRVICEVVAGNYVLGEQVFTAQELAVWLRNQSVGAQDFAEQLDEPPFQPLSEREMEVLGCMARGLSNKEIATALGISHQTVKNHVTSILHKLGVEDRTQAVLYALRYGWVRLH